MLYEDKMYACMLICAYLYFCIYFILMAYMPFCLYDLWQWKTDRKVKGKKDWDIFMF